jgi:hypothetical protein
MRRRYRVICPGISAKSRTRKKNVVGITCERRI